MAGGIARRIAGSSGTCARLTRTEKRDQSSTEQYGSTNFSSTITGIAPKKIDSASRYEWRPLPAGAAEKTEESINAL